MLCGRCFNKDFARALEIDFPEAELQPVVLTSRRGKRHTFQFRVRLTPGGQVVEAFEVKRGERGGYQFKVLGDFEADTFELLARLYERIHRALGRQEIPTHHGMPHLPVGGHVRGRIDHDRHADTPLIVVDGRAMSWQEFGLLWNTVEGVPIPPGDRQLDRRGVTPRFPRGRLDAASPPAPASLTFARFQDPLKDRHHIAWTKQRHATAPGRKPAQPYRDGPQRRATKRRQR